MTDRPAWIDIYRALCEESDKAFAESYSWWEADHEPWRPHAPYLPYAIASGTLNDIANDWWDQNTTDWYPEYLAIDDEACRLLESGDKEHGRALYQLAEKIWHDKYGKYIGSAADRTD